MPAIEERRLSLIQKILVKLLDALRYDSGQEITLKLDPYLTQPSELAIEILSPEDSLSRVWRKCLLYEKWGIRQMKVIDPGLRLVWTFEDGSPRETGTIARRGEHVIVARELWEELDRQLH